VSAPQPTSTAGRPGRDALSFLPVRALRAALTGRDPEQALSIGAALGRRVASLGGHFTDLSRINLSIAFPEESIEFRDRVLFDSYANLGRGVAELALLQGPHRDRIIESVRLEGEEHEVAASAASSTGGILVVSAHFGTWDLYAAAMARRYPLTVVHRGFSNAPLTDMLTRVRAEGGDLEELLMGPRAAAGLLGAIRRGRKCILLLDQNARAAEGVFVPFFSRLACTRSAPAVIAMRRQVPVLPVFGHRKPDGSGHVVRIGAPLAIEPGDTERRHEVEAAALERNVGRMTQSIEAAIRERPEQWMWSQRRWRTRPADPADPLERASLYPPRTGWLRAARRSLRARRA